jgi:hypothetical protein
LFAVIAVFGLAAAVIVPPILKLGGVTLAAPVAIMRRAG